MRIAYLLDDTLDKTDGVQQYVLGLGAFMTTKGHEVHYIVGQSTRMDVANVHSAARLWTIGFNGNIVRTPKPVSLPYINKILRLVQPDVVHVQMPYSPLFAGRVISALPKKVAVIGTFHIFPNSWLENTANSLLTVANSRTLKRFNSLLAVSPAAAKASGLIGKRSISVLPNHVNLKAYKAARTTKQNKQVTIVFLGRLVQRKGCRQLLTAVALLNRHGRIPANVRLIIGGDGPLKKKLEEYAVSQNISKIVSFRGFVSEHDKPHFLADADIAVFPSSSGESFGIVLIEALAAGTAVLAGNNEGYSYVLERNNSQLFSPLDTSLLANKLLQLIESPTLRQKIVLRQDKVLNKFDINTVGQQIEKIYQENIARLK